MGLGKDDTDKCVLANEEMKQKILRHTIKSFLSCFGLKSGKRSKKEVKPIQPFWGILVKPIQPLERGGYGYGYKI